MAIYSHFFPMLVHSFENSISEAVETKTWPIMLASRKYLSCFCHIKHFLQLTMNNQLVVGENLRLWLWVVIHPTETRSKKINLTVVDNSKESCYDLH